MSKPGSKANPPAKKTITRDISYVTKNIGSSLAILDSTEDTVVIEALIFITQYVNVQETNLRYLERKGLLKKLLNLFNRNKCILRLVLKLLGILLTLEQVMKELDQEKYDEKVLEMCNRYISSSDPYVRQYCVSILSKLTESSRITCNIFSIELFKPIVDTIRTTTDVELLQWTLELFLRLLKAPCAFEIQQVICKLDFVPVIKHLSSNNENTVRLVFEAIERLTYCSFDLCQEKFKNANLVEKMLTTVMSQQLLEYHALAFNVIHNCLKSEVTSDYFIKSLEFLEFCQWVKTCNEEYLFPCILIIEHLTRIPDRRQILFDLSVEEAVLSCLRSTQKKVLNKTCEAICNMMTHKYCCEQMLTPDLIKDLFLILARNGDEEDPQNEVALKTIIEFSRRNLDTLDIIHDLGVIEELLNLFNDNHNFSSEDSFQGILEMLQKISLQPQHRQEIINPTFFERLLQVFQQPPVSTAGYVCQILINFVSNYDFRCIFLSNNGPKIFLDALQRSTDTHFLKTILLFIYNNLTYENVVYVFLRNNLVQVLKEFPETLKHQLPIVDKILKLIYNSFPSLKFFETGRLEVTDHLSERFYLINGLWRGQFPFLEDLEECKLSTLFTVYVVDYTEDERIAEDYSIGSDNVLPEYISSYRTLSILTKASSNSLRYARPGAQEVYYGKLAPDHFLPKYIIHVAKYISQVDTMEEKVKTLAEYIHAIHCVPEEGHATVDKVHNIMLHVEILKQQLGTNLIPIGFLRLGTHCERALLFKAIADKTCIPTTLVKGKYGLYWNEVALFSCQPTEKAVQLYVVDLIKNVGELLLVGSRAANQYCALK